MDRSQGRACQQPALDTGVARAQGLVVGVEEVVEVRLKHLVPRHMGLQHQCLEKPGGVDQVPLGWAGVRHGLDALVFRRQRLRQDQTVGTDFAVTQSQRSCRVGLGQGEDQGDSRETGLPTVQVWRTPCRLSPDTATSKNS